MKLVLFPGGGNPDTDLYSKVYGLLVKRAPAFGYSAVDTSVRWPGHVILPGEGDDVLTFQGALAVAKTTLAGHEGVGEPYDILARSFGTYIALKATMETTLQHLRRVILWGAPPFWHMWQMFVRDLEETKDTARAKGILVDKSLFPSLHAIESLLQETPRKVIVVTGTDDKFSTPAFHSYLMQITAGARRDIVFRPPVKGAPHEVTAELSREVVDNYLDQVLG